MQLHILLRKKREWSASGREGSTVAPQRVTSQSRDVCYICKWTYQPAGSILFGTFWVYFCFPAQLLKCSILLYSKKLKVLSNRLLTQPFSCYCALTLLYTFKWLFKHQGILQFVRFQCKQELEQPLGDFMAELQKVALKFPLIKCFPARPIFPCSKLFKIWQNISVHIFHGRTTQREKSMERNCNMRKKKNRSSDISSLFPTEENC